MYKETKNKESDLKAIVDIYNEITGRKRTTELHKWEWFTSPYKNKSYVIVDNKNNPIGHHGLLTIKLNFKGLEYNVGKTENTIMKKAQGPLYYKNELAMHKEYLPEFDVLMTTSAWGVIRRIREKLGYECFANYVTYLSLINFSFVLKRLRSKFIIGLLSGALPFVNLLLFNKSIDKEFIHKIKPLNEVLLEKIEGLYNSVKDKYGFMQIRSADYLRYRFLDNPYSTFEVLLLYKNNNLVGVLIYSVYENRLIVEDVLFEKQQQLQEMLNRICNHARKNKLAEVVVFTTLKNSILDIKYKHFVRRNPGEDSFVAMIKNNIKDEHKKELKVENFYFTNLTAEGIR